ncbi:MAG TPA: tetratricopeptide repeat protein [Ktedonobacteraceae bacterium]|nr:tetratricopeptide repeat protein [Ktedonobacteraceae bacterium]
MPGNRQVFSTAMNAADRFRWDSQWTNAAKEYQRALAEFPDDAAARGGLGFCYMQTKQWQKALAEYETVLERDPSNVIALSKTAELYVILNRREEAYKAYMHLAELYSQAGQGARAEAAWQKAVQLSPVSPEPHERLASYYQGKKDFALMVQERIAAAQGYMQSNEHVAATMQCEEVLRVDSSNTQAQRVLAQIRGQVRPSGPLPQGAGEYSSAPVETGKSASGNLSSGPLANIGNVAGMVSMSNTNGGNTGIMGSNMGSASKFGGAGNSGPALTATGMSGGGMGSVPRTRITASQVTGVLRQAQTFQTQGRYVDAIDLCEQILANGFDRPDARYFLGWLYQEQRRWDDAIRQFQTLLNDPDYALSCFYALGQCYRAKGDLHAATQHFDEAVDRVNLDALTFEESDQLVQLCQEAAEAHRMLGEQEQALTVYNALLGFLRSRQWNDKVAQVEFMLQQLQNTPPPSRTMSTPPPEMGQVATQQQPNVTNVLPPEQVTMMQQAPAMQVPQNTPDAAITAMNANGSQANVAPAQGKPPVPATNSSSLGELPDWLTGILNDADKTEIINKQAKSAQAQAAATLSQPANEVLVNQPTIEQPVAPALTSSTSWLTDDAKSAGTANATPSEQPLVAPEPVQQVQASPVQPPAVPVQPATVAETPAAPELSLASTSTDLPLSIEPIVPAVPAPEQDALAPVEPVVAAAPVQSTKVSTGKLEDLLIEIAGTDGKENVLQQVSESVRASTANLPENVRLQVVQSIQDIQRYIDHGLYTPATEECLRVIDLAPQYLDIHLVLCEIYIRQGKNDQAITKYAILIDTYMANNRVDDAIATYRRILQLEPNNLTYRVRLINLLALQGYKEDLLRERSLAAESYLRLGYMDRALTELEQALQENPTSVPTRLNYALALQKLGRSQQAIAEYQRVLQVDPRNKTALVRWHIAMITGSATARATTLEVLTRIRWLLRGEGQKNYDMVVREYIQASETYPNNADVWYALGQLHQQAGYFDKALDAYQFAIRDSSYEVMARLSSAQCLLAQGKPEAAIQHLEQALQLVRGGQRGSIDPTEWAARPREDGEEHQAPEVEISLLLAKAYRRVGKHEQMEAILRQLKQTTPQRDEVSTALAEISARQGNIDNALEEYLELVHSYREKRQGESAMSVLKEMIRLDPQDPRAHAELGDIYIVRGYLEEGISELSLLVDIYLRRNRFEEAGDVLRRIGDVYAETGESDKAYTNFRRAVELKPNDMALLREVVGYCWQIGRTQEAAQYQVIIARHYFETNQVKESVAALQQLIALDRTNYEAYDMLGQTYQSVGEYEQASRVYKNLAKANPDGSVARERLAALQELREQSTMYAE